METTKKPVALIVGGSSGLGLQLAMQLSSTYDVLITGRKNTGTAHAEFRELSLTGPRPLCVELDNLVYHLPHIDLCIYAAGAHEDGSITDLHDSDMLASVQLNLLAPAMLMQRIVQKQGGLANLIVISSTAQWEPRMRAPLYTAGKAGLAMLTESLSIDARIKKTMLVAPAGMDTPFWEKTGRDTRDMLNPKWVATEIMRAYGAEFRYRFIRVLHVPMRTDIVATRP